MADSMPRDQVAVQSLELGLSSMLDATKVLALNPSEAGVDGEIIPISVPTD